MWRNNRRQVLDLLQSWNQLQLLHLHFDNFIKTGNQLATLIHALIACRQKLLVGRARIIYFPERDGTTAHSEQHTNSFVTGWCQKAHAGNPLEHTKPQWPVEITFSYQHPRSTRPKKIWIRPAYPEISRLDEILSQYLLCTKCARDCNNKPIVNLHLKNWFKIALEN